MIQKFQPPGWMRESEVAREIKIVRGSPELFLDEYNAHCPVR